MATSLLSWSQPTSLPASSFAVPEQVADRMVTAYRGGQNDQALFEAVVPQSYGGGTLEARLQIIMESATTGDVDWDVEVEAVTPGDATDLDAGFSFDTVNSVDGTTVPGTAGHMFEVTVTLTNADSAAAGDLLTLRVTRDGTNDTASGKAYLARVELREQ